MTNQKTHLETNIFQADHIHYGDLSGALGSAGEDRTLALVSDEYGNREGWRLVDSS